MNPYESPMPVADEVATPIPWRRLQLTAYMWGMAIFFPLISLYLLANKPHKDRDGAYLEWLLPHVGFSYLRLFIVWCIQVAYIMYVYGSWFIR